ncbi:response regulator [Roseateles cellulosilyticus]|uniref:Response regulator n=1 Tax=Pelomonas cellulosilytica TaxID=2906762 RepID=A0ABS8XMQ1_9BURK|nr:response regulator [Pelomonas sp. P8]MCE4553103.1 response regulator [Pelomonas sp. P8]
MPNSRRRTVLYVEDHPVNALQMAAIFERRPGLSLVIANSGAQALRKAAALQPALLLLDLGLPDCHGADLLLRLRSLPGCQAAPAVAVTADAMFATANTGFRELWAKPLQLEHVLARLDALAAPSGLKAAPTMPSAPNPSIDPLRALPAVQATLAPL